MTTSDNRLTHVTSILTTTGDSYSGPAFWSFAISSGLAQLTFAHISGHLLAVEQLPSS